MSMALQLPEPWGQGTGKGIGRPPGALHSAVPSVTPPSPATTLCQTALLLTWLSTTWPIHTFTQALNVSKIALQPPLTMCSDYMKFKEDTKYHN